MLTDLSQEISGNMKCEESENMILNVNKLDVCKTLDLTVQVG